jgi:hypothetical protein
MDHLREKLGMEGAVKRVQVLKVGLITSIILLVRLGAYDFGWAVSRILTFLLMLSQESHES